MFAAVDLGSNSFRLHIGKHDGETMRIVKSAREPVRLGAGLDDKGGLTPQAMRAATDCLSRFSAILAAYPLDAVRVVATNTIRIATNSAQFLPAAEKAIGYPIEIISGEEEGRLIYLGVTSLPGSANERRLVADIGGGSTELILGDGAEILQVESFTIGTASHNSGFFPDGRIDPDRFDRAVLSARSRFEDAAALFPAALWDVAYGSSGTIRAIADAIAKNNLGDGRLSASGLEALRQKMIAWGHVSRIELAGLKPDRVSVIVGGLAILTGLMQELGIESMEPSEAGLRMGVLADLHLRATRRDRREQAVRGFLQRFHTDERRADRVAEIASALHGQLKPSTEIYDRLLVWSALLHETGMAVSHSGYHKHGAYLVENADLPGFTAREQRTMGTLVLGQKGNLRKLAGLAENLDFAKAVLALRLAVLFMHSRIENIEDGLRLRLKIRIELELRNEWVREHPTLSIWLDKEKEHWKELGTEFSIRLV